MRSVLFSLVNILVFSVQAYSQHYYYTPNSIHIPVLSGKNEWSAGAGLGWGSDYFALEVQSVYSPAPHAAVMFNGFASGVGGVRSNEDIGANFRFLEIAGGAYQALEYGSASIFAGAGQGNMYNYYGLNNFSKFTVRRYFVQPGLMYENNGFRCGLALRLSRISYPKGESSFDISDVELAAIRKIEKDSPFFLPEFGISGGMVLSPCIVSVNVTTVFPDVPGLNFSRFNLTMMLTFEFGKKQRKK